MTRGDNECGLSIRFRSIKLKHKRLTTVEVRLGKLQNKGINKKGRNDQARESFGHLELGYLGH